MTIELFCFIGRNRLCSRIVSGHPLTDRSRSLLLLKSGVWFCLVVLVAAFLRCFRLGAKSFWLDEAASTLLAIVDREVFLSAIIHRQANMVLYYVLLRGWTGLGSGELAVRSLSVVAGVAAIPAIYLLGKRLFGPKAGRVAALLLSVHAFHIRYSQEGRAYSLFMLLAILSSLLFVCSLEQPSRKNWGAYILVSTLMVYAQVFGGWVLLAQWISLLVGRREVRWRQFLFSAATICLLIFPLAYCLLFISDRSQLSWLTRPLPYDFYRFCLDMTGDGGPFLLFAFLALAIGAFGVGISQPRSHSPSANLWTYWFLLIWLALPVTLVLAISLRLPAFEPRFLIFCVPPLALLAADALAQVRSKLLFATTLMIVLGLSLNGTYSYYRARADTEHSDNWRDATRFVLSQAQMGDAVLFIYSEERIAFDAYQRQFQMTGSVIHEFPEQTDLELLTLRPSRPSAELLENLVAKYRRVWVLSAFQPNRASRQAEAVLRNHFSEYRDRSFGFVHAYLFADHIPYADHQQEEPR
jgi:mannosyltransferase